MKARIGTVLGSHWGGIAQAIGVVAQISTVGAIGGLPALLNALTRSARFVGGRLKDLHWRTVSHP
jgi:hypothetical protein